MTLMAWSNSMSLTRCSLLVVTKLREGRPKFAFYVNFLATGVRFNVGEQRPAMLSGELALTSTRLPNGTMTAEVARRQSDGSWRWVIDQPAITQ